MVGWGLFFVRRKPLVGPIVFAILAFNAVGTAPIACAQEMRGVAVEGYITALRLPAGFDVNGARVARSPETTFGLEKDKTTRTDSPLRGAIAVGAYVWVLGPYNDHARTATARTVLFREDWNKKLNGLAVIDGVADGEPEPLFQADGYQIRITPGTQISFAGSLHSLRDVGTNNWLKYEGKRGKDGVLEASKVQFLPARKTKFAIVPGLEVNTVRLKPADATGNDQTARGAGTISSSADGAALTEDQKVKIGLFGNWKTIPADQDLQQRIHRIGMALVPKYQREMADGDPAKIHFRFYAVDDAKTRSEICLLDGAVLIPRQVFARLKNDDQLAAVLADGVAYNLQRQAARTIAEMRKEIGIQIAGDIAIATFPPMFFIAIAENSESGSTVLTAMEEQRGRVALALLKDAGYDPWQAPEAWRLVTPKHLPKDLNSLKYPSLGGYQLGILNLQYKKDDAGALAGQGIAAEQ